MRDGKNTRRRLTDVISHEERQRKRAEATIQREYQRAILMRNSFYDQAKAQDEEAALLKARLEYQQESTKSDIGQAKAYKAVVGR